MRKHTEASSARVLDHALPWAAAALFVPLLRTLAATAGAVPTVPSESPGSFDPAAAAWGEPRVPPQSLELAAVYRFASAR